MADLAEKHSPAGNPWPDLDPAILDQLDRKAFDEQGFLLIRGGVPQSVVDAILGEIEFIIRDQVVKFGMAAPPQSATLNDLVRHAFVPGSPQRHFLYNFLRHVPSLRSFASSGYVIELLKRVGFRLPITMEFPTVRFDIPGEEKHLTRHHQDLRSVRCARAATIWFPLVPVNERLGSVKIYPGSQRLGLQAFDYDSGQLSINAVDELGDGLIVDGGPGDLLVFNSMAVHASVPGKTDLVKINGQCFWNDAAEVDTSDEFWALNSIPDAQDLQKQEPAAEKQQ